MFEIFFRGLFILVIFGQTQLLWGQTCLAYAGEDTTVCTGIGNQYRVYLDGSNSSVESGSINYEWSVLDEGITINSSQSDKVEPYFKYPQDLTANSDFRIELLVYDNNSICEDRDTIIVTCYANMCPTAVAGDDQELSNGCILDATLDASETEDPEADNLIFQWSSLDGFSSLIQNANSSVATFTFPVIEEETVFSFLLSASDDEHTVTDIVKINYFVNESPIADAGPDLETCEYQVTLNGNGSYDVDWDKLTYQWSSLDGLALDQTSTATPLVTNPIDLTVATTYRVQLEVSDGYCSEYDTVMITVQDNLCPVADAGEVVRIPKFETQTTELTALASWDPEGSSLTYEWKTSDGEITVGPTVMVTDQFPNNLYTRYLYYLQVMDDKGAMDQDSIEVIFSDFSAPRSPAVFAVADHNRVLVSWDASSEASYDSLTGYSDFEGYKLYRSTDGGITWGSPDDRLYDYDGRFVGWMPYAQYDLDAAADKYHCIYDHEACGPDDPVRGISIYGLDPLAPRFSLGSNSGINYAFIDSNVYDGIEYTYTVTAYDIGLAPFAVSYTEIDTTGIFSSDTIWSALNPGHFLGPSILSYYDAEGEHIRDIPNTYRGYPSLESKKGQVGEKNYITVVPGYTASNITFPDETNMEVFFTSTASNVGTGTRSYFIVDRTKIVRSRLKYEIQADQSPDAIDGMACENPYLFGYEIDELGEPLKTISFYETNLTFFEKDSLADLPGSIIESDIYYVPDYNVVNQIGKWSELFNGIRFKFENDIPLNPFSVPDFIADTLEWSMRDGSAIDSASFFETFIPMVARSGLTIRLEYATDISYYKRLNMDYKIDFYNEPVGDSVRVLNFFGAGDMGLPVRVTNLWTGKKVGLNCYDYGSETLGTFDFDNGASDNTWTRREVIGFRYDTLSVGGKSTEANTFKLIIDYELPKRFKDYDNTKNYLVGDSVSFGSMIWKTVENVEGVAPSSVFLDENNDGVRDNPWRVTYPWQDSLTVIIRPEKFYLDGDSWVSDMAILGAPQMVEETTLSEITVVPNPYIVHSKFNETPSSRKIRFTHLPQRCQISIFTISGEFVTSIHHEQQYDGNAWWDLTNNQGALITPGLYIFTVESHKDDTDKNVEPYIGKFAVIR